MGDYISPWMTEELSLLRDSVAKFYAKELVPHEDRWHKAGIIDREAWNKAGEFGVLGASVPEEYGGGGGTFAHEAVIYEEQAYANALALNNNVHSGIVTHYLYAYGSEEQRHRWLPKMASGEFVGAIAMTEPGTGSDLQSVKATAKLDGNQYVINGQKTFISNGQHADLVIVVAKTDPGEGAKGISLIVVETAEAEGYSRGRNLEKMGLKSQDTSELFFDNVRVPTANLLGTEEGQGFYQLMEQLPQERLTVGIQAVSSMELAIKLAAEYAHERQAFGKPILDFQALRFSLAECKTVAHIGRVFLDNCIIKHMEGGLDVPTAAMLKWWTTDQQCQVVDKCLQVFGGYGYMDEYPISRLYADARVQKIYAGTNEMMKELIGRTL